MNRGSAIARGLLAVVLGAGWHSGIASGAELPGLAPLARSILGADQGAYVEAADGSVLLAQAANIPVHPASVSKVPTTLALLRKLGPDYRFVTTFAASGPVHDGTIAGDLVVDGGGDPYFVDENALLVAQALNELGVNRVAGVLRARGALLFDWESNDAAAQLQQALSGKAAAGAWLTLHALSPALSLPPALRFDSAAGVQTAPGPDADATQPLLVHRSQPLLSLVKSLNDFSNNIFKPLADAAGGAAAVEDVARDSVPESMRSEITLGDGAGTDARNRLSPRAAVNLAARTGARTCHHRAHAGRCASGRGHRHRYAARAPEWTRGGRPHRGQDRHLRRLWRLRADRRDTDQRSRYRVFRDFEPRRTGGRGPRRQDRFVRALLARINSLPWSYQPDSRPAVARAEVLLLGTSAH